MYIVQKLDKIFCRHQLGPFDLWCDLGLGFLYWFFVWMTYLLVIGEYIKVSHYHCVGVYILFYVLLSFRVCLIKLGALMLGVYRLIIVISFWCISPFSSMKCPSLFCLINVSLKSTLSEVSIASPVHFGGPLVGKSSSSLSP
jgi:hypothetical protein